MKFLGVLKELRRRRVFRVAGIYLVGAWVLLQVTDVVAEPAGFPAWTMTLLLYLVILGFPIAMFMGWRYQLTEHGLVRTKPIKGGEYNPEDLAVRRSDYLIFASLIAVLGIALYGLLGGDDPLLNLDEMASQQPSDRRADKVIEYRSIAVLPFTDMSAEGDAEYLGDGLADTLLHVLAQINGLKVAARTSSFAFRNTEQLISDIAWELGVAHVLEGSVQRSGDQVRVIAQLIEAVNGSHLWSRTYTGAMDELFQFQDEIANEVVRALEVSLLQSDADQLENRYRPEIAAYDQLVLGRYAMGKGTVEGLQAAVDYFERAIELDPNYALPHVYLADTYGWLEIYAFGLQDTFSGLPTPPTQGLQRPLLEQALRLDPASGEAYASLAAIEHDEAKAEAGFLRAIELTPNYANAYLWYSKFLGVRQGKYEEALTQIEKALELDPLSDLVRFNYAKAVWATGRAEKAMSIMLENVKSNPDFPYNYKRMARWKAQTGQATEAMRWIMALRELEPESPSHWGEFGGECFMWALLGDGARADQCEEEFAAAFPESVTAKARLAANAGNVTSWGVPRDSTPGNYSFEPMLELYRELVEAEPYNDYRANQLAFACQLAGEYEELLMVVEATHPELFEENPVVTGETIWPAMMASVGAQRTGDEALMHRLLDAIDSAISGMRLIAGPGFTNGIENVEVAAMRGETDKALRLLREALDQNWRFLWNFMPYNPSLESIRDDPRYQEMWEEIVADIDQQRAEYYELQDEPLF
ncbi:MAG TPA: tetratricopeptide repeat protein [Xanthomonadales bacterium]|nr:tetratricopeptide repeat protein [Xanthomonadales bacterium]